jgi:hypothetical protein
MLRYRNLAVLAAVGLTAFHDRLPAYPCGVVGYLGKRRASDVIFKGLE